MPRLIEIGAGQATHRPFLYSPITLKPARAPRRARAKRRFLLRLRQRLWAWKDQLLPKHPMAEAVGYVLNQWNDTHPKNISRAFGAC